MKKNNLIVLILLISFSFLNSCKKDNFKEPKSILTGTVVFNKEPINVRSNAIQLELWQHGFDLFSKIPVYLDQDGNFSAVLFNGDYKLTLIPGNGPWSNTTDSIDVHVNGSTTVDVPVKPYFSISNVEFSSENQETLKAQLNITKNDLVSSIENVSLFIGSTTITDNINNMGSSSLPGNSIDLSQPIQIDISIPASAITKGYLFARVGVKTSGVSEYLFSKVKEIQLK